MSGALDRELVYSTLFSFMQAALQAQTAVTINTISRTAVHYIQVDPRVEMPAVYQLQRGEQVVRKRGLGSKIQLQSEYLIYTAQTEDGTPPSTAINQIITALDAALQAPVNPDNTQHIGLPGIVEHCWIEGKIEIYEVVLDGIPCSISIVPIHTLCTD
jgi:hypothetical protein